MPLFTLAQSLFLLLGVAGLSAAHPGHHEDISTRQLDQKINFFTESKRSLDACSGSLTRRGVLERSQARRKAKIAELSKNSLGSGNTKASSILRSPRLTLFSVLLEKSRSGYSACH